ncbi:alpha-(1,3)-fucosyltransferase C-like isoform X2 [Choristoneura fumiferana]|uniref:alpha-(1,3)-fucosyltransferase C-like isoform X2 n=1 Tax=Choristoneura fumiferana TaxID=7141 RepID=UPI003D15E58E
MHRFKHTFGLLSIAFAVVQTGTGTGINVRLHNVKYILQWAGPSGTPNLYLGSGMGLFVRRNCTYTNCFLTANKYYFHNFFEYDAVVFDTRDIQKMRMIDFPQQRFQRQRYILTATESAYEMPLCKKYLDKFFNWTWTYKLNSDLQRPHVRIYNTRGKIVGPRVNMKWPKRMLPLTESTKRLLLLKSDAAAWFVNDRCATESKREQLVLKIHEELKKYGWRVDIFGRCAKRQCTEFDPYCREMLKRDYYFYFAFETSLAEDYIHASGKLLGCQETRSSEASTRNGGNHGTPRCVLRFLPMAEPF